MGIDWIALKDLRELLGITQAELAKIIGVHPKTIVNWESDGVPDRSEYKVKRRLGPEIEYIERRNAGHLEGVSFDEWKQATLSERLQSIEQEAEKPIQLPPKSVSIETELLVEVGNDPRTVARMRALKPFSSRELLDELVLRDDLRTARMIDDDIRKRRENAAHGEDVGGSDEDVESQHQSDQALAAKKRTGKRYEENHD